MKKRRMRLLRKLWHVTNRRRVLAEVEDGGQKMQVVDLWNWLPWVPRRRAIDVGRGYYTVIFTDPRRRGLAYLRLFQPAIDGFAAVAPLREALVMGCAGCAVPRYLVQDFGCHVTGVEYSPVMIDVARRWFYIDTYGKQFDLVEADARRYVLEGRAPKGQDVVIVDLFQGETVNSKTFTRQFLAALEQIVSEEALVAYNIGFMTKADVQALAARVQWAGFRKYMAQTPIGQSFLFFVRLSSAERFATFAHYLQSKGSYEEIS